jgi:hypothetical protein
MLPATARSGSAARRLLTGAILLSLRAAAFPIYVTSNGSVRVETSQGQDLVLVPGASVVARGLLEAQARES